MERKPFVLIPDAEIPLSQPFSEAERNAIAAKMELPSSQVQRVQRRVAVSMPDVSIALEYMRWVQQHTKEIDLSYSFTLENTETWKAQYGEPALRQFVFSMIA